MSTPSELNLVVTSVADAGRTHSSSAVVEEVVGLFDELRSPLFRYLLGFSLAVPDSEDILQETFLALFQHLQRDKSRQNLRAWLFRVAHNLALKKQQRSRLDLRNISKSALAVEDFIADPAPNPEDQLAATQKQARIVAALNALPEQNRWCLYLRAEGLRYREIAEVLEMSLGAVSLSLERSLARIARAAER
jgi:RNA polymerase sigma-70 factor, ECF subfamily